MTSLPVQPVKGIKPKRRVCLISIDGWGLAAESKGNAVTNAKTPVISALFKKQHAILEASGLAVGLPAGVMGNSEVGHLTMGAGRVNFQDLERINLSIEKGTFGKNPVLQQAFKTCREGSGRVHFLGLVSDGGVHSHIDHLKEFLKEAKKANIPESYVQFFADGRDTPPTSGVTYIRKLQDFLKEIQYGQIATVIGRYYAMDRDKRWERIQMAYEALVAGKGESTTPDKLIETVQKRYAAGENDEFLKPIIVNPKGCIGAKDVLIFIDFRSDRMRQIVETFGIKPPFESSIPLPANLTVIQMTQYNESFKNLPILYPPQSNDNVLAEWISKHGLRQFHTAETEKYAHVTFFFNGGREAAFDMETRVLVPSPRVATYDLTPTMSMDGVRDQVVKALGDKENHYAFVMCNLAPPDMIGHTGKYNETVQAVEACDKIVGEIQAACHKEGFVLVVTADHGNAEEMLDEQGNPKTSHTTNPVFFLVSGDDSIHITRKEGGLCDVAPSILHIMNLPIPTDMTGTSLVK